MKKTFSLFAVDFLLLRPLVTAVLGTSLTALATDREIPEPKGTVVEIRTSAGRVHGQLAEDPLLIIEEEEDRLIVYRVTADSIRSIAHGIIKFYNRAAGRWIVSNDLPQAAVATVLTAIEETGKLPAAAEKVYWLQTNTTNPQWLETIRNVELAKKWRLTKATPLKVLDSTTGTVPSAVEVKDITELKIISNVAP